MLLCKIALVHFWYLFWIINAFVKPANTVLANRVHFWDVFLLNLSVIIKQGNLLKVIMKKKLQTDQI